MKTFEKNSHMDSLQRAWAMFSGKGRDQLSEFNPSDCSYMPAAGFANGVTLWLLAEVVIFFQKDSQMAAVILGTFLVNGLLLWSSQFSSFNCGSALSKAFSLNQSQSPAIITQIIILFRLAAVAFLLQRGLSWWLILIPLLPAYLQSVRLLKELGDKDGKHENNSLICAIVLALIPVLFNAPLVPTALAFAGAYFISPFIDLKLNNLEFEDQLSSKRECIELIMLCFALLLLK